MASSSYCVMCYLLLVKVMNILTYLLRFLLHLQIRVYNLPWEELKKLEISNWSVYLYYVRFSLIVLYILVLLWLHKKKEILFMLFFRLQIGSMVLHVFLLVLRFTQGLLVFQWKDLQTAASTESIFNSLIFVLILMDFILFPVYNHKLRNISNEEESSQGVDHPLSFDNQLETRATHIVQSQARTPSINQPGLMSRNSAPVFQEMQMIPLNVIIGPPPPYKP